MPRKAKSPQASADAHAFLGPSALERWSACPAAPRLESEAPPEPSNQYQAEGSRLHTLAEQHLRAGTDPTGDDGDKLRPYLDHVRSIRDAEILGGDGMPTLLIETRVSVHGPECWGTLDAAVISGDGKRIWIIDLKTGSGKPVPANENKQLLAYALGVVAKHAKAAQEVTLQIVQPPISELADSWPTDAARLKQFGKDVKGWVAAALDPRAKPVPGGHCGWCKAQAFCPAKRTAMLNALGGALDPQIPRHIEPAQLTAILDKADAIREWLDACEKLALVAPPPGWKVVAATSKRKWIDDDQRVAQVLEAKGIDKPWRLSPITIGEAEKILGKGNLPEELTVKPPGKPTLAKEADPRPAIDKSAAFADSTLPAPSGA